MKHSFQLIVFLFPLIYGDGNNVMDRRTMAVAAGDVSTTERWGPVCRGFDVSFPNGESGRVTEIRLRDGSVQLLVDAASSPRRLAVDGADVEAILPQTRRIIIRGSAVPAQDDAAGVDAAGGIIRMPARHSSRAAAAPEEAP